jgi:hypothetical protein
VKLMKIYVIANNESRTIPLLSGDWFYEIVVESG